MLIAYTSLHQPVVIQPCQLRFAVQAVPEDSHHRVEEVSNTVDWTSLVISVREDAGDPCPICWENIKDSPTMTGCGHRFHEECLAEWRCFTNAPSCPMCRGSLAATARSIF